MSKTTICIADLVRNFVKQGYIRIRNLQKLKPNKYFG